MNDVRPNATISHILHFVIAPGAISLLLVVGALGQGFEAESEPRAALPTSEAADSVPGQPVLAAMQAAAAVLDGPFSASFEIRRSGWQLGPRRGRNTEICRYTTDGTDRALRIETNYHEPPRFQPLDLDGKGNLILWRPVRKLALSTRGCNQALDEQIVLRISPDDTIVEQVTGRLCIFKYDIGDPDSMYEVDHFLLAVGLGVAKHLREATRARTRGDGLVELKCEGSYGGGFPVGDWAVVADPNQGHIVRSAVFTIGARTLPYVEMKNSGSLKRDGMVLAQKGALIAPGAYGPEDDIRIDVRLLDFSRTADAALLDEASARVATKFPPGTDVVDYRAQAPKRRYTVGEEPRD